MGRRSQRATWDFRNKKRPPVSRGRFFDGYLNSNFKLRRGRDVKDACSVGDRVTAGVEKFQVHRLDFMWTQDAVAAYRNAHIKAAQWREHGCCSVRIRKRGVGAQIIQREPQRPSY